MPAILPTTLDRLEAHEVPAAFDSEVIKAFIHETKSSEGSEIANAHKMFGHLCRVLNVPEPGYKRAGGENEYCYEEDVKAERAHRRIDVYYRGRFVFEAKQGVNKKGKNDPVAKAAARARVGHSKSPKGAGTRGTADWLTAMTAGRNQAGNYALWAAKRGDPKPPFIIVADLGHRFWVWSSFQPDVKDDYGDFDRDESAAFTWDDLLRPEVFAFLRTIWLAPEMLNEEAIGQRVTAEIAERVCELAARLEKKAKPEEVGEFLMRCVFTMFAEDVGLIPTGLFSRRLDGWISDAKSGKRSSFVKGLRRLWMVMNDGGDLDSGDTLRRFNGYLFKNYQPLDLELDELEALREAASANWRKVSPAIFGTLLEHALTPEDRHKLGAHYTPEAYIRRLVEKTVMEPLRVEWSRIRVEIDNISRTGVLPKPDGTVTKPKNFVPKKAMAAALEHGHKFRRRLASIVVLDPACGSGNFLFVVMKEMKRLEGEVERTLLALHKEQNLWLDIDGETVRPVQFWGIEVKPWAAKIAELVLWVGYLQWQVSAGRLSRMREPLIEDLHHIKDGDALITWDKKEPVLDERGKPVLRAVGVTDKKVSRRMEPVERYRKVKVAIWPKADFIVGNPPFLGNKRMNDVLTSGYVDAIREAFPKLNKSADLVMWWWWRCAELLARGEIRRFGLVTTNSITQTFNRMVVADALETKGIHLDYAIPDHPWYDEGAAVRIAMTVASKGAGKAVLGTVMDESRTEAGDLELVKVDERDVTEIHPDLTSGAKVSSAIPLLANRGICFQGITLVGEGFRLSKEQLQQMKIRLPNPVLKRYIIGRDINQHLEERWVIDFQGLSQADAAAKYPVLFGHVVREVKPQRMNQNDAQRKAKWWLFGRSGEDLRAAISGLERYIVTSRTSRHRLFVFVDQGTLPDTKIVAIASDSASLLGVLSSRPHKVWAERTGGWLGVGNDATYNHSDCFGKFPFPVLQRQRAAIAKLGESIDKHRKMHQAEDGKLALTDVYNVMEKLRAGAELADADECVRKRGSVDTLKDLHDQLDALVFDAYKWPVDLSDDELMTRLVALNVKRAQEEAKGKIQYLRPEFQKSMRPVQVQTSVDDAAVPTRRRRSDPKWPSGAFQRAGAVVRALQEHDAPAATETVMGMFEGAPREEVLMALQNAEAAQFVSRIELGDGHVWFARG